MKTKTTAKKTTNTKPKTATKHSSCGKCKTRPFELNASSIVLPVRLSVRLIGPNGLSFVGVGSVTVHPTPGTEQAIIGFVKYAHSIGGIPVSVVA